MELNDYQEKAMTTCMESSNNFSYMFLNLVGEVGEFASKVAKHIRKNEMLIGSMNQKNELFYSVPDEWYDDVDNALKKEAGDVLWQLSGLCHVMGWTLEEVAQMNLDKLAARKAAGTIIGEGDGIERGEGGFGSSGK